MSYSATRRSRGWGEMAEYQHKWLKGEPKVSIKIWDPETGQITFSGDALSFSNAFGQWQRQKYSLTFDPIAKKIVDVKMMPGQWPETWKRNG